MCYNKNVVCTRILRLLDTTQKQFLISMMLKFTV